MVKNGAAIFSNESELEILLRRDDIKNYDLIALTPMADYSARIKKIPYQTIEDIVDMCTIFNEGAKNFEVIEDVVKSLEIKNEPLFNELINSWYVFFCLKIFYDSVFLYDKIFNALLSKYNSFIVFKESAKYSILISENVNLLPIIAEEYDKFYCNNKVIILNLTKNHKLIKTKIKYINTAVFYLRRLKYFLLKNTFYFKKNNSIFLSKHLNNDVINLIKKKFNYCFFPQKTNKIKKKYLIELNIENINLKYFSKKLYLKIFLNLSFSNFLNSLHQNYVPYLEYWINYFKKKMPKVILSLMPNSEEGIGISLAAKRLKILQIIPQHGGFVGYVNVKIWNYAEKKHSDYIPCYGKKCIGTYTCDKAIPLGSSTCYSIYNNRKSLTALKTNKKILFISDGLQLGLLYFTNHIKPAIEASRTQQKVIEIAHKYGDIFLKLYPGEQEINPVYKWINDNNFTNIKDLNPEKLENVLMNYEFDLIITEAPATTLLYAVSTNIPIIAFYDKRYYDFTDEGKNLLSKRVTLYETYEDFINNLDSFLQKPLDINYVPNDEFLFSYGLVEKDVSPLELWNNFLNDLLNNKKIPKTS